MSKKGARTSFLPIALFFLFLVAATALASFYLLKPPVSKQTLSPTQGSLIDRANEFTSTVSALPVVPFELSSVDFASLVPAEATLFVQSRLPSLILQRLLGEEQEEEFNKKTGLTLSEATSFLGDDYAFAKTPGGFLFLFKVKDGEFIRTKIAEFSKDVLKGGLFEDTLVVSDSSEVIKEAEAAFNRKALSLSQVNEFFESRRRLPKSGQIFIYSKDKEMVREGLQMVFGKDIAGENLSQLTGSSFVIDSALGSAKIIGVYERQ